MLHPFRFNATPQRTPALTAIRLQLVAGHPCFEPSDRPSDFQREKVQALGNRPLL